MKKIAGVLGIALLAAGLSGCADDLSSGPSDPGEYGTGPAGDDLFLLNGPADARLPEPALVAPEEAGVLVPAETEAIGVAGAAPSVYWNGLTTELCAAAALPPPKFARAYALVHTAIYDALAASRHRKRRDLVGDAVAAGAASTVLEYLFPSSAARIAGALQGQLRGENGNARGRIRRSLELGRTVGALAVERGMTDGSDAPFTGTIPSGPGIWSGTNPVLPMCGQWTTWICANGAEFQPEPPYAFGSALDSLEVEQVYEASLNRTPEQIAIVRKWADLPPPTIWNEMLNERILDGKLGALEAARAHAYLNCAMYDAFVSCWYAKYANWTARPVMRLQGRTPAFTTVVPTPNFPTYTSGHSTISGAAAVVMGELFPDEQAWFDAEADEAALSRFLGGIHFHHDDNEGLVVGRRIGERVVDRMRSGAIVLAATP